jgi:uncharacterized membrane protein
MAWVGQLPLRTPWLATALVLYVVMVVVAVAGYTPALKRQMVVLDRSGVSSPEYQAAAARAQRLGALLGVVVVAIVFLMVVKPALWG